MGLVCCKKIYYVHVEDDEIYTGNFDSRRDYWGDEYYYDKPNTNQNFNPSPQNPFVSLQS